MTLTTTPVSGRSTAESSRPSEASNGNYSQPPGGIKFPDPYQSICNELHALLTRKRGYYGCPDEGPLDNAMGVREQGIAPWLYQLARIGEKVRRGGGLAASLRTLVGSVRGGTVRMVRNTLLDIAGHAIVAVAVLDEEEKSEHQSCNVAR
jgi:hypothetical protein